MSEKYFFGNRHLDRLLPFSVNIRFLAVFLPGENNYLNCHIYPNGKVGEGVIQMEITTNNIYKDTITWTGVIFSTSSINKLDVFSNSEISQIYDISGRKVDKIKNSGIYIIEYSNNIRQKFRYIY